MVRDPAQFDTRFFIDGEWVAPQGRVKFVLVDPATEAERGSITLAGADDVDRAVASARRAFDDGWGRSEVAVRCEALAELIGAVEARREDFARTISAEVGSPIDFAREHQVARSIGHLEATLDAARGMEVEQRDSDEYPRDWVFHEPVGVAALITPWNWPLNQIALKAGAALAAGCAMVLKPSELAPGTGRLFAECMAEAGLPAGVFNLIQGDGAVAGDALSRHADIDIVSFTGSTRAGRAVARNAAEGFKRTVLELGGKSANLLFADCDLEMAIRQGVAHAFRNAGQSCNAASRMLVERSVYQRAVELAAEAAAGFQVGMPDAPGSHIGPLVSEQQFERVQTYIAAAISAGALIVAGGPGRPDGFNRGYFVRPTVFADVTHGMAIAREEIFGPVLVMMPFGDEDEAVRLANDTPYGLAAYIQTGDNARAVRVSRRLQAGMVQLNGTSRAPGAPFGGVKQSGWGREAGLWGIRAFQDVKSVSGVAIG